MYAAYVVIALVSLVTLLVTAARCIRLIIVDRARQTWGHLAVSVLLLARIAVQWIAIERGTLDVSATVIAVELVLLAVALLFAASIITIPRAVLRLQQTNRTLEEQHAALERRVQTPNVHQPDHALLATQARERTADLEREIAECRRAEIALRQSENQLRTTLDALDDMLYVVDEDLRITLCNAAFQKFTQESGLETNPIGRTPFELFPYLSDEVRDQFRQVFVTGNALVYNERFQIGQITVVNEARKIPIKTGDRVTHVVTVLHDITERKRPE